VVSQPAISAGKTPAGRAELKGFRLLVVEDNPTNQEVALGILGQMGYRAEAVPDGLVALRALAKTDYDLVLMDCQMPELDGYECTRRIRQADTPVRNHRIPIVAMTAHAMSGDREKCLASGMDDYLTKPIHPGALREVLEKWLAGKSVAPALPPARPDAAAQVFDGGDLVERMLGDEGLARRAVRRFLSDAPQQLAALAEAVSRADAPAARLAAHSLKGAAANVGGTQVSATAKRVEMLGKDGDLSSASELIPELATHCDDFRAAAEQYWTAAETGS
jgi:CheY-like chemotaxis protein/HPt (histidine-containing phosphotransfer) domain-containing protein